MFYQTFTRTFQYFYTDISVISVTFRNSGTVLLNIRKFWQSLLYRPTKMAESYFTAQALPQLTTPHKRIPPAGCWNHILCSKQVDFLIHHS